MKETSPLPQTSVHPQVDRASLNRFLKERSNGAGNLSHQMYQNLMVEEPQQGQRRSDIPTPLGQKAPFLEYIHSFRGIAILFIVAGHVSSAVAWQNAPFLELLLKKFLQNGTVYFVFISGYLFQHLSGKYRYGPYLACKIKNIIAPYIVMSLPAIIVFTFFAHRWSVDPAFYEQSIPLQIATFYVTGSHLTPYWFIPMIALYYLISPILIWWDRRGTMYLLLPLLLGVSFCVSRGTLPMNCAHFFSVYVFGMFCSHYRERVLTDASRLSPLLVALAVGCLAVDAMQCVPMNGALNLVQKLSLCLLLLYWLARYPRVMAKPLSLCATLSFGIYFVHPYVIAAFNVLVNEVPLRQLIMSGNGDKLGAGSVFTVISWTSVVVLVSMAFLETARRLLSKYSRMMVGS